MRNLHVVLLSVQASVILGRAGRQVEVRSRPAGYSAHATRCRRTCLQCQQDVAGMRSAVPAIHPVPMTRFANRLVARLRSNGSINVVASVSTHQRMDQANEFDWLLQAIIMHDESAHRTGLNIPGDRVDQQPQPRGGAAQCCPNGRGRVRPYVGVAAQPTVVRATQGRGIHDARQ